MRVAWPILALVALVLAAPAPVAARPAAAAPANPVAGGPRRVLALDADWRFERGTAAGDPSAPAYRDDSWQKVNLPHSWNRIGSYSGRPSDLYQGVGWYRRGFATPPRKPGDRSFLQFDGASVIAEVWLNGRRLGRHAGAFSRFRFDVTDLLHDDGQPNMLAVKVDNSKSAPGSSTADVIPLSGDFFLFGGLYRDVSLVTTSAAHIDLMDHGGPGIAVTTRSASPARADLSVVTRVRGPGPMELRIALDDAQGRTIARSRQTTGEGDVATDLPVAHPHLWDGRRDPYLYRLRVEIWAGGTLRDRVVLPYGVRTVRFDADRGFFLNGRHVDLHGVSRHQDVLDKGWALSPADHARDMAMIEELGANTIRMAHYQHAPDWYDLADRDGMIAWAEIPYVNQAAFGPGAPSAALVANARQQLTELIRQNEYRPSIVTWSVGNEIDLRATQEKRTGRSYGLLQNLARLAKQLDPSRATTFADCCEPTPNHPGHQPEALTGATDLIGYNRYLGWYSGKPADFGATIDALHARHPHQPLSISEYGAGGAITQHSDNPLGGLPDTHGLVQPEEYQSWVLEQTWPQIAARPYLWSSWVWNMFDFASPRKEGDSVDLNTKGLVTADRRTRKDAFYYFQAQWSASPVLHLTSRRYTDRAYPVADVKAYSNADRVRLRINGRDLGERPCPGRICLWPAVHLAGGRNHIEASATIAGRPVTDAIDWTAPDAAAGYGIIAGSLIGQDVPGEGRFGSDNFFAGGDPKRKGDTVLAPPIGISWREGAFDYALPVPAGDWAVTLWLKRNAAGPFRFRIGDGALQTVAAGDGIERRTINVHTTGEDVRIAFPESVASARVSALSIRPLSRAGNVGKANH